MKLVAPILTACVAVLSACSPVEPIVSDYNGASVKIQIPAFALDDDLMARSQAEATRICKESGKSRAEPASKRGLPDYQIELLYLCL